MMLPQRNARRIKPSLLLPPIQLLLPSTLLLPPLIHRPPSRIPPLLLQSPAPIIPNKCISLHFLRVLSRLLILFLLLPHACALLPPASVCFTFSVRFIVGASTGTHDECLMLFSICVVVCEKIASGSED